VTRPVLNGLLVGVFFAVFGWLVATSGWGAAQAPSKVSPVQLGQSIFTTYGAAFEVASLLLLAALVGAVFVVRRPGGEGE